MPNTINEWVNDVYALANKKGWCDEMQGREPTAHEILAWLMLVNTELSEAAERVRAPDFNPKELFFGANGKPDGFGIELADAVIRIMDTCGRLGIDLQARMHMKHGYNGTRPNRHGGKRA